MRNDKYLSPESFHHLNPTGPPFDVKLQISLIVSLREKEKEDMIEGCRVLGEKGYIYENTVEWGTRYTSLTKDVKRLN